MTTGVAVLRTVREHTCMYVCPRGFAHITTVPGMLWNPQ